METLDLADIQGIVARGYGSLKAACYLLVAIDDPAAARAWLRSLSGQITTAAERPEQTSVNIAFTFAGLRKLGLPAQVLSQFSYEFRRGMTDPDRGRALGDVDQNAREYWAWGGPRTREIDLLLMLFAADEAGLARLHRNHSRRLQKHGLVELMVLPTAELSDREHFGFRDGISQPIIEGLSKTGAPENTIRAGEFILGYRNEYDLYTNRPLVDPAADPRALLPADAAGSSNRDFGRNGSYLVVRQLAQDVCTFWRYLDDLTRDPDGASNAEARTRLAAKMVGRWPSGASLVKTPNIDIPDLANENQFMYHHEDRFGLACPIGSHVRRNNPRDSLDPQPGAGDSIAVNKRHRLLRRGRAYGTPLEAEDVLGELAPADAAEDRGLYFICVNANLARQFEFVQHTWLNNPHFDGLYDDVDPLVGQRYLTGTTFTVQSEPLRQRYRGLPQFVAVRGGAYFFLPGTSALRYLAAPTPPAGARTHGGIVPGRAQRQPSPSDRAPLFAPKALISDILTRALLLERRLDPYYRDTFDWLFQKPLVAVVQTLINLQRSREHLNLSEEILFPYETEATEEIIALLSAFTRKHYPNGYVLRPGNTKTYGVVRGTFEVLPDLPPDLRVGVFCEACTYPAWVRFSGPGPLAPPDIEDNGILSIGIKLMGVDGPKLIDDEKRTQDFTGLSAPTFTTPNIVENVKLQRENAQDTAVFYFVNPFDSHLLDGIMQALYSRPQHSPLEVQYWSCVPYLLGEGRAMQFTIKPCSRQRTPIPRPPSDNYLREAMIATLKEREVTFDFMIQLQTDPRRMPIENASVIWPKRLSPFITVAKLRLPVQEFDSTGQRAFAGHLSYNPWHSIEAHRPLGSQNRARKAMYLAVSQLRQSLNREARIEPTGSEVFPPG